MTINKKVHLAKTIARVDITANIYQIDINIDLRCLTPPLPQHFLNAFAKYIKIRNEKRMKMCFCVIHLLTRFLKVIMITKKKNKKKYTAHSKK